MSVQNLQNIQNNQNDLFYSALNTKEYPNDDYSHLLGYGITDYTLSRLQDICRLRLIDIAQDKKPIDTQGCGLDRTFYISKDDLYEEIREQDDICGKPINLYDCILSSYPKMAIAAEFKRASPSKGPINMDADPVEQCLTYARAGVSVISVLTEFKHFKGTLNDLKIVRKAVQSEFGSNRPAILRKDFILDRYQILEARASGADTILLIVAILGINQLKDLIAYSRDLSMEPLVEVNSKKEMEIAIELGAKVIGVNNRNLHNFQLDLQTTNRALEVTKDKGKVWKISSKGFRPDILVAALSGISTSEEVHSYYNSGISCCLIGEALMKSPNPKQTISELISMDTISTTDFTFQSTENNMKTILVKNKIVKTCGYKSELDVSYSLQHGSNLIGMIFAEKSPRKVSIDEAKRIVSITQSYGERSYSMANDLFTLMSDRKGKVMSCYEWFEEMSQLLANITLRKPLVVGVFQDQSIEYINEMIETVGLDMVQLHGNEDPSILSHIHAPCIKVIHLPISSSNSSSLDIPSLHHQIESFANHAIAILLDSKLPNGIRGGTGQEFDWSIVSNHLHQPRIAPVLLAGGLHPMNVIDAMHVPGVIGVDVSSGIEVKGMPGQKDMELVTFFLKNAKTVIE